MHRSFGGTEPPPTSAISHFRFGPRGFWPSLSAALRPVCMEEAIALVGAARHNFLNSSDRLGNQMLQVLLVRLTFRLM